MATAAPAPALDRDLVTAFAEDGFVRLGRILDQPTLDGIRAEEAALRGEQDSDAAARGARTLFFHNVTWRCPTVRRLVQTGPQLDAMRTLLGNDLLLWWTQFVTKMPEDHSASSIFPWHQDCGYLDILPTPVTVWVALDDVDVDNGCVWVVHGSHRGGLLPHKRPSDDAWHLTVPIAGDGMPVPLAAGEAVAFTGYTLHRSLRNGSSRPRRAFFMEYAPAHAREAATLKPCLPDRDVHLVSGAARF
jgi:hypothetical protein